MLCSKKSLHGSSSESVSDQSCSEVRTAQATTLQPGQICHLLRVTTATSRHPERDRLVLLLVLTAGMRITEIAKVEVQDLLFPTGALRDEIRLRAAITKGCRQRCIYLAHPKAMEALDVAYIANFTLQRVKEAASLRTDCLLWENDPKLGKVPIICGDTTKTDSDSDARWPTSPSIETAITVRTSIARMRMRCAAAHPGVLPIDEDQANPYLFDRAFEPWAGGQTTAYRTRRYPMSYGGLVSDFPLLFDRKQLQITEDDLKIARMTPNLSAASRFGVGQVWPLAWHQLRRTGAVNMFASGLLSDSSIQFLLKHSSRLMPLYYGRGYVKLHVNEEVESVVIAAMSETMAQSILSAMSDRFVSPNSDDTKNEVIVNLIGEKDAKDPAKSARRGEVFFRKTRLGACTTRGNCTYGGIESVARCAGGDGFKPCKDVIYDRCKAPAVERQPQQLDQELARLGQDSPRHQALLAERKGLENFLNVVQRY